MPPCPHPSDARGTKLIEVGNHEQQGWISNTIKKNTMHVRKVHIANIDELKTLLLQKKALTICKSPETITPILASARAPFQWESLFPMGSGSSYQTLTKLCMKYFGKSPKTLWKLIHPAGNHLGGGRLDLRRFVRNLDDISLFWTDWSELMQEELEAREAQGGIRSGPTDLGLSSYFTCVALLVCGLMVYRAFWEWLQI